MRQRSMRRSESGGVPIVGGCGGFESGNEGQMEVWLVQTAEEEERGGERIESHKEAIEKMGQG